MKLANTVFSLILMSYSAGALAADCIFGETAYPGLRLDSAAEVQEFQAARGIIAGGKTQIASFAQFDATSETYQSLALALVRGVFDEPLASKASILRYALNPDGFTIQELELKSQPGRRFVYVAFYPGENEYGWVLGSVEKSIVFTNEPGFEIVARVNDGDISGCKIPFKP